MLSIRFILIYSLPGTPPRVQVGSLWTAGQGDRGQRAEGRGQRAKSAPQARSRGARLVGWQGDPPVSGPSFLTLCTPYSKAPRPPAPAQAPAPASAQLQHKHPQKKQPHTAPSLIASPAAEGHSGYLILPSRTGSRLNRSSPRSHLHTRPPRLTRTSPSPGSSWPAR